MWVSGFWQTDSRGNDLLEITKGHFPLHYVPVLTDQTEFWVIRFIDRN